MSVRARRPRGGPSPAGLHVLRSSALADELVRGAGVGPGDLVVDVGAGAGALTRALVAAGAEVVAVEIDDVLAAALRRRFPGVRVVADDAARVAWPRTPFTVVANLPFARSAEILRALLGDPLAPLRRADVIVQWELAAKRAAVWPSTLQSLAWSPWYELAVTRRLDASAFAPRPPVDAAVLTAVRRAHPLLEPAEARGFAAFLREAFVARKPLRAALARRLSPLQLKRLAAAHGFAADAYARDLDAVQWAAVYRFVRRGR